MTNIQVTCNSSETAIIKKTSTNFLKSVLNELEIDNKADVINIFSKVKSFRPISDEEADLLLNTIKTQGFIEIFNFKVKEMLEFVNNNEHVAEYNNLLISLISLVTICKIEKSLVNNTNVDYGGKNYRRMYVDGKLKFCEVIEEIDNLLVVKDLKSGRNLLIDIFSNKLLLKSKKSLVVSKSYRRVILPKNIYFVDMGNPNSNLTFPNGTAEFSTNSYMHLGKYALYIVDEIKEKIISIELDTLSVNYIDISSLCEIKPLGKFLITCIYPPIYYNEQKELDDGKYDFEGKKVDGKIDLYSLELNRNVINNIDNVYQYFTETVFICMSSDLLTVYYIDTTSGDIISYCVEDFVGENTYHFDEKTWQDIIQKILKENQQ